MEGNEVHSEISLDEARHHTRKRWFIFPVRHLMAVLMFFGFCNVYGMRVNFSVAIVKMVEKTITTCPNGSSSTKQDFDWDTSQQGILLSSFFWGYLCTQIPGGLLAGKFGGKRVFGFGIFMTSVFTLLTPTITNLVGFKGLLTLRVLEGLGEGVTYPAVHSFWSKWAPKYERTKLITISHCGAYAGTVFSMPLSGLLADNCGWEWVFRVFGCFGLVWTVLWHKLASDLPEKHTFISEEEMQDIRRFRGNDDDNLMLRGIPWRKILSSMPLYAVIVVHSCETWGFYTLMTELPTYMARILNFNLRQSGFLMAIPYLVLTIVALFVAYLSDFLRKQQYMSTTHVRKVFLSLGFLGQLVFLFSTAYANNPTLAVVFLTFAVGFGGCAIAAFSVNHLDISPRYVCVVMSISNSCATIPGILSPTITGFITAENTVEEWRKVFFICSAIYAFGIAFYLKFASGSVQSWNY